MRRAFKKSVTQAVSLLNRTPKQITQDQDGEAIDTALQKYDNVCGRLQTRLEEIDGVWGEVGRVCQEVGQCGIDAFGEGDAGELKQAGESIGAMREGSHVDIEGLRELTDLNTQIKEMITLSAKRKDFIQKRIQFAKKLEEWRRKPDKRENKEGKILHYERLLQSTSVEIDKMTLAMKQNVQYFDAVHINVILKAMKGFAESNKRRIDNNSFDTSVDLLTKLVATPPQASRLQDHPQNLNDGVPVQPAGGTFQPHNPDPNVIQHQASYAASSIHSANTSTSSIPVHSRPQQPATPYQPAQPPHPPYGSPSLGPSSAPSSYPGASNDQIPVSYHHSQPSGSSLTNEDYYHSSSSSIPNVSPYNTHNPTSVPLSASHESPSPNAPMSTAATTGNPSRFTLNPQPPPLAPHVSAAAQPPPPPSPPHAQSDYPPPPPPPPNLYPLSHPSLPMASSAMDTGSFLPPSAQPPSAPPPSAPPASPSTQAAQFAHANG